jgi:DNA-binding PadR family transcriptional regulator
LVSTPRAGTRADREAGERHGKLPATAYALLGLLSFDRELSGYDLKKWADSSLRFFYWAPAVSQIYSELKRLDGLGYVTARDVPQDGARTKRVYRITETGRVALRAWVEHDDVEPPVLKHAPLLRVWLGHLSSPARLRSVLVSHRDHVARMRDEADESASSAALLDGMAFPAMVTAWSARYYEREIEMIVDLLAQIDSLA